VFWLSFGALVILGGADMVSVYVRQTLIQIVTPDPMRGRVASVSFLFIGASNELGEFESGVTARLFGPVLAAVLDRVGLEPRARTRAARTYSRGMVQRLALARALLTQPSLLLLDEPFTGLDRGGALALGAELGKLRDGGAIVVVVTHDLEAIAGRTDHVAILRRGQLVFEERGTYDYERLKDVYHQHAN